MHTPHQTGISSLSFLVPLNFYVVWGKFCLYTWWVLDGCFCRLFIYYIECSFIFVEGVWIKPFYKPLADTDRSGCGFVLFFGVEADMFVMVCLPPRRYHDICSDYIHDRHSIHRQVLESAQQKPPHNRSGCIQYRHNTRTCILLLQNCSNSLELGVSYIQYNCNDCIHDRHNIRILQWNNQVFLQLQ